MSQLKNELKVVDKTIRAYVNSSNGTIVNNSRVLCSSSNQLFQSTSSGNGSGRDYTVYSLKNYPYYHASKASNDLQMQKHNLYKVAASHGHNGSDSSSHASLKSDYFKHKKYHSKNEFKHGENFDNKPIYQHILKRNEFKTVSELKEDYRRMVEESKKNAPKMEKGESQDRMKDFSLGVD